MTTPTAAEIKARYPELAGIAGPTVNLAIADAEPWFDVTRWDSFYAQGFAAFVAHMLTVDKKTAAGGQATAGPQQAKSVGDASVSYTAVQFRNPTDAFFATTTYGQRYLQLRRLVGMGALAV